MSEREEALLLAERLLNEPNADPDDELRMLSRTLLRYKEWLADLKERLHTAHDPMADMIQANRDAILRKHEEAIRFIADAVKHNKYAACGYNRIEEVLLALAMFHPMHGESWKGWPDWTQKNHPPG